MKVINSRPPNYAKIIKAFPYAIGRGVIFCYGGVIYSPFTAHVSKQLHAHERVHVAQQEEYGTEAWWDYYIESIPFRLEQEIPAHRAEYQYATDGASRHERRAQLSQIAKRMALPLYGPMITYNEAKIQIKKVFEEQALFRPKLVTT